MCYSQTHHGVHWTDGVVHKLPQSLNDTYPNNMCPLDSETN